jgi:gliding motility-associated lipoprotein GldD
MNKPFQILSGLVLLFAIACNTPYSPRPKGYFRIDFPEHAYKTYDVPGSPYSFEYPVYGEIKRDSSLFDGTADNPYWINVDFPRFNGRIYISYMTIGGKSVYKIKTDKGYKDSLVTNTYDGLRDEAFRMTFKHSVKANGIEDSAFRTANGVQGVYFHVEGNAATSRQFFVTDSTRHFLRGALYFDATPNADSLGIVNDFLEQDMKHIISTLRWK